MNAGLQYGLYLALLAALAWPLGKYLFKVMNGDRVLLTPVLRPIEKGIYRLRIDENEDTLIETALEDARIAAISAYNGDPAISQARTQNPDVILLDLGLPDMDGIQVVDAIRRITINPIIIVSARSDDADKIEALDHGADDYVTKPFNVDELMARVRAAARRVEFYSGKSDTATVFENGGLCIHYDSMEVTVRGEVIHLTPIEYRILKLLAQNIGRVLTHSMIIRDVWGSLDQKSIPSLRVFMTTLKKSSNSTAAASSTFRRESASGTGWCR